MPATSATNPLPPRRDIILAFDVGRKKTGIAVGNRISGGARPLGIVRGERQRQLAEIEKYITEWQPALIVIGLPLYLDGGEHNMTARARRFAAAVEEQFNLPVVFADERRSSELARRRQKHGDIDDSAAAIILQNWLDHNGRAGDLVL